MSSQDFDVEGKSSDQSYEEFSEGLDITWQEYLATLPGGVMLCEVDTNYIEDGFNLFGLRHLFPNFEECLDSILDRVCNDDLHDPVLAESALKLYGLIHARFIITGRGLDVMYKKYKSSDFGRCPRVLCRGQSVLPYGIADEMRKSDMKIYCPKCNDVYSIPKEFSPLDGAFIGTTFTHLFTMAFEKVMPKCSRGTILPHVFGFKIHSSAQCMQRLKGLPMVNFVASSPFQQQKNMNVVESNVSTAEAISGNCGGSGTCSRDLANGTKKTLEQIQDSSRREAPTREEAGDTSFIIAGCEGHDNDKHGGKQRVLADCYSAKLTGVQEHQQQSELGEGADAEGNTGKVSKGRELEMDCKGAAVFENTRSTSISNSVGRNSSCPAAKRTCPPSSNPSVKNTCRMGKKRLASR